MKALSFIDLLMGPLVLLIILLFAYNYGKRKSKKEAAYQFYFRGTIFKMLGTLGFCAIYILYFTEGGDTLDYHKNGSALINLLMSDLSKFIEVMASSKPELYSYFNGDTGFPVKRHFLDAKTFNVSRILMFPQLLCANSYIATCMLVSFISFAGLFRIFRVFMAQPIEYGKYAFYFILVIPSVLFWSGGISKEVIVITALGYIVWSVYHIQSEGFRSRGSILVLLLCMYVLVATKPYMFIALFPGIILWFSIRRINTVKSVFLRVLIIPPVVVIGLLLTVGIWQLSSSFLGEYSSIEGILGKAAISQEDLQNERYDGSSFDIGAYDPTPRGVLSKFPQATIAGAYRPFIFESNNAVMFFSALENTVLLIMTVMAFVYFRSFLRLVGGNEYFVFCLVFSIILAFAIGLSTSNFGALVRFKIPLLPFFSGLLYCTLSNRRSKISE